MTRSLAFTVLLTLLGAGCPENRGSFTPDDPVDAGVDDQGIDFDGIGSACLYDPRTGEHPDKDCGVSLKCLIFTEDGEFQSAFTDLDDWEDQTTTYHDQGPDEGLDEGTCTLFVDDPAQCPVGTVAKMFSSGEVVCLRTCNTPSECGRSGYTCDQRYLDILGVSTCVRKCRFDYPECVRSGVIQNPAQPGTLLFALAQEDLDGTATCDTNSGRCQLVSIGGAKGPGEACENSAECASAVCLQSSLLSLLFSETDETQGFCASVCTPGVEDACTTGYSCQEAGVLTLDNDEMTSVSIETGEVLVGGGFCFRNCALGIPGSCDGVDGAACGAIDEATLTADWNQQSMCLPPLILR